MLASICAGSGSRVTPRQVCTQKAYFCIFRLQLRLKFFFESDFSLELIILGLNNAVFDPDLSLQLRNERFRLQQLLPQHSRPLHPFNGQRLRLQVRPTR